MSITDKHLTRAQRTRYWHTGTLRDKSAAAATERPFNTGAYSAIITRIVFVAVEEVQDADILVNIGYTYNKNVANPVTADADFFAAAIGFTNGLREEDTTLPVAAGSKTEHDVRIVVPPNTWVQIEHTQTSGLGTYYTWVEYHYEDGFPAEV